MAEDIPTGRPEGEAGEDALDKIIREAAGGEAPGEAAAPAETASEPAATEVDEVELPKHWSDDEKAKWKAVGPEQRALLLDARKSLEKGYQDKFQSIAEKRKHWKEIKEIFAPLQDHLKMNGATKLQAIRQLAGAQMALMNRPDQALAWLAQQYAGSLPPEGKAATLQNLQRALGIQGTAPQKPNPSDEYLDPKAAQEIAALKQQLQQFGGYLQQSATAQQQQAVASAERVIQDFAAAKDASGSPAHPYFEEVRPEIERLLQTPLIDRNLAPAERLRQAYDKAIRLNTDVWDKIDLERKQAKAKAEAEKRRAEVAQAKPAARNVQGQSVSTAAKGKRPSLDDALNEALAEARA